VLKLKAGAQVISIKNTEDGLVNGSLGVVLGFIVDVQSNSLERLPLVEFTNGIKKIVKHELWEVEGPGMYCNGRPSKRKSG